MPGNHLDSGLIIVSSGALRAISLREPGRKAPAGAIEEVEYYP